jgi:hypothetical protein
MSEWNEAKPEVIEMAQTLIAEYHKEIRRANIAFVMKSDDKFKLKKHQKWAVAAKIPAKYDAFLDFDFLIWIQEEIWRLLNPDQRRALIDHELSHCGFDENDQPVIIPHDFEEFSAIIERHGLWRKSLKEMGKAASEYIQEELKMAETKIEISSSVMPGKVASLTGAQLNQMANPLEL